MLRRFYQLVKSSNDFLESPRGLWFIALLIKINAIVLGLQTISHLPHSLHTVLEVADQIILGVFVCELVIRLLAERLKFFLSGWNVVDLVIVLGAMSFTHTFLPILRVFRALHLLSMVDTSPKKDFSPSRIL